MDRVAFLIEDTGERLGCLLNPSSIVIRRVAGVRPRRSTGGALTGGGLSDDPLLFTGGGTTEIKLDLLFDVSIAGSSIPSEDVRDLTRPLWRLAENRPGEQAYGRPPLVRFVWAKSWNIPGVVTAVAERLEYFTAEGVPKRSWLRMRMIRVDVPEIPTEEPEPPEGLEAIAAEIPETPSEAEPVHQVVAGAPEEDGASDGSGERIDQIAHRYFGSPAYWRILAAFNQVVDPLRLKDGQTLRIPPYSPHSTAAP